MEKQSLKCPKCGYITLNILKMREIWCLACENRVPYGETLTGGGQGAAPIADNGLHAHKPQDPGSMGGPAAHGHALDAHETGPTRPRLPKTVFHSLARAFFVDLYIVVAARNAPAVLVRLDKSSVSASEKRMETDEDLEPVETEEGVFLEFTCNGDSGVRRYFQQRSIIDSKTFAPREHRWVCAYWEDGDPVIFEFPGRLYNYADEPAGKVGEFKISGKIMASSMFVSGR